MKPLKILFSAYACEPGKGSEPGTGWRWVLEAARLGHEVWVITRQNNAEGIERGLAAAEPGLNLHFVYFDLPQWIRRWKRGARGVHLYYSLWQWGAYRVAAELHRVQKFDAVQHITFGVTRHASFMGRLGLPFVLGPVGGGETAPMQLRRHFALNGYVYDAVRDLANIVARMDPSVRAMCAQASLILCRSPQTLRWLPQKFQAKAQCMLELGNDPRLYDDGDRLADANPSNELRLLYVGRFLYLKGIGLGLRSIALLKERKIAAKLTLIGEGPEHARWKALAEELGIADQIDWVPWMPQAQLFRTYKTFDAMLFPSLRDSGGNVVLESLSGGLPVVCLGLGGPAEMVDSTCGRVIAAEGRSEAEVVKSMADALAELAGDPALRARLRAGASTRAAHFKWQKVVGRVWGAEGLGYRTVTASRGPVSAAQ
jgi:glycosyltransferase involved in cell wall biosynthesis